MAKKVLKRIIVHKGRAIIEDVSPSFDGKTICFGWENVESCLLSLAKDLEDVRLVTEWD